jgi:EAL domain-containing protein (putative c-di-GMP-specific phosphodiesterase class I)
MDCLSEGIERAEQLTKLLQIGCDYGQGYLFSKPVPASDALELLSRPHLGELPADSPHTLSPKA